MRKMQRGRSWSWCCRPGHLQRLWRPTAKESTAAVWNRNIGSSGQITFAVIFWNSASVDMKSNGSHCRMSLKPCNPGTPAFTPPGRKKNFCVTSCTQHCKSMIFVMWRSLSGIITRSGSMSASGTPWTKQRRTWLQVWHFTGIPVIILRRWIWCAGSIRSWKW